MVPSISSMLSAVLSGFSASSVMFPPWLLGGAGTFYIIRRAGAKALIRGLFPARDVGEVVGVDAFGKQGLVRVIRLVPTALPQHFQ